MDYSQIFRKCNLCRLCSLIYFQPDGRYTSLYTAISKDCTIRVSFQFSTCTKRLTSFTPIRSFHLITSSKQCKNPTKYEISRYMLYFECFQQTSRRYCDTHFLKNARWHILYYSKNKSIPVFNRIRIILNNNNTNLSLYANTKKRFRAVVYNYAERMWLFFSKVFNIYSVHQCVFSGPIIICCGWGC